MKRSKNNFCRRLGSRRYFLHENQSRELREKSQRASHKKLKNKRNLSADSCSLLLSALRPRLLNVRIFGTMPIRLSTLKVRKLGLRLAMPMAIITFMLIQNAEIAKVSAVSLELTVPTNFSVDLSYGVNDGFGVSDASQVSVKTGAFFGYTLSINAKDGNNLKNGANLLTPIAQEFASDEEFKTSGLANTWGYKPSKFNSTENTKFLPGPNQESTIEKTDAANSDAANSYDLSIATKIDATTVAGTYTNTFVFSATANTTKYKFTYNGGEEASQVPAEQSGDTIESTIKLDEGKPERENYEFLGWCDVETSDENCTGETYQPGDTYPKSGALKSNDNDVTFYAIWKSVIPTTMQEFGDYCDRMQVNQTLTLKDVRDNNSYSVAKLLDGKCWMTSNLRIGKSEPLNLNSSDTDISSQYTLPKSQIFTSGSIDDNFEFLYIDNTYGGYYSWIVATAGTGKGLNNEATANGSICPRSWRLPRGQDFSKLTTAYNNNSNREMFNPPISLIITGTRYPLSTYNDGWVDKPSIAYTSYWASTKRDDHAQWLMVYSSGGASNNCNGIGLCGCSACNHPNYSGKPIRCIKS